MKLTSQDIKDMKNIARCDSFSDRRKKNIWILW